MITHEAILQESKLSALLDDPNFQRLVNSGNRFNVFEALGVRRQELRHSDFLSYLLDPSRPHGLGDEFLRDFLISALEEQLNPDIFSGINIRLENLNEARVYREKYFIDIVIELPGKWVVLIENKIGAGERKNQLDDYKKVAREKFSGLPMRMIFLTPDAREPSDDDWLSLSYRDVYKLIRKWGTEGNRNLSDKVTEVLSDYGDYLESHVLDDSYIAELCKKIYKKHREAVDTLVDHIPSPKDYYIDILQRVLQRLVEDEVIIWDDSYNRLPRFIHKKILPYIPDIEESANWTSSRKGALYEWEFSNDVVRLDFVIGPINRDVKTQIVAGLNKLNKSRYLNRANKYLHITKDPLAEFDIDIDDYDIDAIKEIEERFYLEITRVLDKNAIDFMKVVNALK